MLLLFIVILITDTYAAVSIVLFLFGFTYKSILIVILFLSRFHQNAFFKLRKLNSSRGQQPGIAKQK